METLKEASSCEMMASSVEDVIFMRYGGEWGSRWDTRWQMHGCVNNAQGSLSPLHWDFWWKWCTWLRSTRPGEEIGVIPALQKRKKKTCPHRNSQRRPWLVALAGIHMRKERYNRLPHTHTHIHTCLHTWAYIYKGGGPGGKPLRKQKLLIR